MKGMRFLQLSIFLVLSLTSFGQGTSGIRVGKDFWMGHMNNYESPGNPKLYICGDNMTAGKVEIPLQGWTQNFIVTPGVVTVINLPPALSHNVLNDAIEKRGVHITALENVSIIAADESPVICDAAAILPTGLLGSEYVVSTYKGFGGVRRSEFLIVATENGTVIDITPSVETLGGNLAGVNYSITLDEGETYQVQANRADSSLIGSLVSTNSICSPFALFAGVSQASISGSICCGAGDVIFEQMRPTEHWDYDYYIAPFVGTSGYVYSVIAKDNGTLVSVDGGAPFLLNAGEWQLFNDLTTAAQISATNPIAVTQFMQGGGAGGNRMGDPCMLVLNGDNQKITAAMFNTLDVNLVQGLYYMNVICETIDVGSVVWNGGVIPAASFNAFPSNPLKSYANVNVPRGFHTLSAPNGCNLYVYGIGRYGSYAFGPGSSTSDSQAKVICEGDSVLIDMTGKTSIQWSPLTGITDPTSTSPIFHPTADQVYYVTYTSLSNCILKDSVEFLIDELPKVTITNPDTIVCPGQAVNLTASVNNVADPTYQWLTTATTSAITTSLVASHWVVVTSLCGSDSDTVNVSNFPIASLDFGNDTSLCFRDSLLLSVSVPENGSALWPDNSTGSTYTVNTTSEIWIELIDSNACVLRDTISVNYYPSTVIDLGPDSTICALETLQLDATNPAGVSYSWEPGNQSSAQINLDTGGSYVVTVTDTNNCNAQDSLTLTLVPLPLISFQGDLLSFCETPAQTVNFVNTSPSPTINEIWSFGGTGDVATYPYPNQGSYDVALTATDALTNCTNSDTALAYISVYENPVAAFTMDPNPTTQDNPTVYFYDESYDNIASWFWDIAGLDSSSLKNPSYSFPIDRESYDITLTVVDENGCENAITNTAIVKAEYGIFVPNAFTPSADNLNDGFTPDGFGISNENYSFSIFNRWGELIYESNQKFEAWDGTYKGSLVISGVYVWKLSFEDSSGKAYTNIGQVNVLR